MLGDLRAPKLVQVVGLAVLERRAHLEAVRLHQVQWAQHAIQQQVKTPNELQGFNLEGYSYTPAASSEDTLVFRRQLKD